eukprot:TRINITY_DN14636_c0_g2_i3.p1 TRINITY_DN14636_c0_g2~~TRINITY_DN14636_c0_g2_i3.p1  ORF type:complete len:124 (-),score=9.38 TRINITY_DN14636_c0_g2_i3:103-474(-)
MHIYNECVILISFLLILIINLVSIGNDMTEAFGLFIIGLIFVSLIITWITLIPGMIKDVIELITNKEPPKETEKKRVREDRMKTLSCEIPELDFVEEAGSNVKAANVTFGSSIRKTNCLLLTK